MLTRSDIIKETAVRTSKSKKEIVAVVSAIETIVNEVIAKKEKVLWKGLFTTSYIKLKERACKLPKAIANGVGVTPAHDKMTAKFSVAKKVEHAEINASRKVQKTA